MIKYFILYFKILNPSLISTQNNLIRKDFSNPLSLGVVHLYLFICDFQEQVYTAESNGLKKKL